MATKSKRQLGQRGEQIAAAYLTNRGYEIITTNWRCARGEIDLVAQQNGVLVFVEVRTRRSSTVEPAFESISPGKQERLSTLAYAYLEANHLDVNWRIDLIAIAINQDGLPVIEHVENGIDW